MDIKDSPNKVFIKIENIIERSPAMINSDLFDKTKNPRVAAARADISTDFVIRGSSSRIKKGRR